MSNELGICACGVSDTSKPSSPATLEYSSGTWCCVLKEATRKFCHLADALDTLACLGLYLDLADLATLVHLEEGEEVPLETHQVFLLAKP